VCTRAGTISSLPPGQIVPGLADPGILTLPVESSSTGFYERMTVHPRGGCCTRAHLKSRKLGATGTDQVCTGHFQRSYMAAVRGELLPALSR